jgi:hypothetical protein
MQNGYCMPESLRALQVTRFARRLPPPPAAVALSGRAVRCWTPHAREDKRGGACSWRGVCSRVSAVSFIPRDAPPAASRSARTGTRKWGTTALPPMPASRTATKSPRYSAGCPVAQHSLALLNIVFSALPVAYNDYPREEWTHFATAVLQARAPPPRCCVP